MPPYVSEPTVHPTGTVEPTESTPSGASRTEKRGMGTAYFPHRATVKVEVVEEAVRCDRGLLREISFARVGRRSRGTELAAGGRRNEE